MRAALMILALGLSACNSSTPTAPTPPPAPPVSPLPPADRIVGMAVHGNQWIATNSGPVQMTAVVFTRLASSDGPGESFDANEHVTWSVDPGGILAIDKQGRATPVAMGAARVIATLGDRSAFNSVRVLPDYGGTWNGAFVVTGCTGGRDPRECGRIMFAEDGGGQRTRYPFSLELSQFRDQITGTLREMRDATTRQSDIVAPVTGFVRLNGTLVLEATVPQSDHEPFRVINWSSAANAALTLMSGAFTQYEPRSTPMTPPYRYVIRTENEFVEMSHAQ